jgi:hypothetical protein
VEEDSCVLWIRGSLRATNGLHAMQKRKISLISLTISLHEVAILEESFYHVTLTTDMIKFIFNEETNNAALV